MYPSLGDRRDGLFGPVPAPVAVHRVVTPDDRRDPLGRQQREVLDGRGRRDVAPVREGVDPGALPHPLRPRELEQREQMVDVRVHAAVRDEPEQVHVPAARPRSLERPEERLVRRTATRRGSPGSRASGPGTGSGPTRSSDGRPRSCPSGRPAARPPRRRPSVVPCGYSRQSRSKTGVSASSTAFPGPGGAQPQPSRMTSVTSSTRPGISPRTIPGRARRHPRARRRSRSAPAARRRSPASPSRRRAPARRAGP